MTRHMLEQVLTEARRIGAERVTKINLVVGREAGVVPDCVRFYFDLLKPGTVAAEAELCFRITSLRLRCRSCQKEFSTLEHMCECNCGADIISGQELVIESIEIANLPVESSTAQGQVTELAAG